MWGKSGGWGEFNEPTFIFRLPTLTQFSLEKRMVFYLLLSLEVDEVCLKTPIQCWP